MGIPAFTRNDCADNQQEGISLRDYFAGQALVGILSSPHSNLHTYSMAQFARDAYQQADLMLEHRILEQKHKCNG